jgi:hypothetical protein
MKKGFPCTQPTLSTLFGLSYLSYTFNTMTISLNRLLSLAKHLKDSIMMFTACLALSTPKTQKIFGLDMK